MMRFTKLVSTAALLAGYVSALPRPDSSSGDEVAVSAPNGIIMSDTAALSSAYASATASAASSYVTAPPSYSASSGSSYGSDSGYGYGGSGYSSDDSSASYDSSYESSSASSYLATSTDDATSISTSYSSYQTSYGSGSSSWGGSGYEDCVQQCVASFGPPPATYTPTATGSYGGISGTDGVTHTVVVAPSQGILRYVPFATNASVGDTIKFMWGANNHTVTKSSELTPCNKTDDAPFASGEQNAGFVFEQVVNDTNPIYFYCGTPGHCPAGMFGIINPPSAYGSNTSVGYQMTAMTANDSNLAAEAAASSMQASTNAVAANWGSSIDLSQLPEWSHELVASNVLYTRAFLGQNEDVIQSDGSINMTGNGSPYTLPADISTALTTDASTSATPAGAIANASSSTSTPSSASSSAASPTTSTTNGAAAKVVSSTFLGVAVVAGAFLAL